MEAAAILPGVHPVADPSLRYFASDGCVDHSGEPCAVYVGGKLIGTFTGEQPIERDLLIVAVCQERRVRVGRVAEAFGVSTETVRRVRRRFERGGVQAMAMSHRPGRPRRRTPQLEQQLFKLFDAGATILEAHKLIRKQVCRTVVAGIRKRWAEQRAEPPQLPRAQSDGALPWLPEPPSESPMQAEPQVETIADELELEQAVAEGGRQVQHLGSWIMLAMLHALGLYTVAERLRAKADTQRRKAGKRFTGRATLRAGLDAVVIALSIGKRCVEGVRWLATPSGATLLRRAQPMSASWTRRVLGRIASQEGAAVEFHWGQAMSLLATATESDERAVFYIDNHMRPYTGKHTIRKGWRMQDKRARPGSTDFYVHDERGCPLLRMDDPGNGALTDWLHPTAKLLREALGGETKVLMAFDRAGAFAEHMASLRDDGLEFVTYERAPYALVLQSVFKHKRWIEIGCKRVRFVEQARKNLGKGRGRVRRIYVQTHDGTQLNVLAVSDAPAELLVTVLLSRWAYQENQFKHDNDRWGINQLDGRIVEPYPADEVIPNPARRRLDRELKVARAVEGAALRKLSRLADEDPRCDAYEQDVEHARQLQDELEALRPAVPTHAPVSETELADKLVRHPGQYKMVIDTLRVALANAESDLAAWLGPELPRATEAKKALAKLLDAPGSIRLNRRTITVALEPAGTSAELRAVDSLLRRLSALALHLPGDPSGRSLRFKLHIK